MRSAAVKSDMIEHGSTYAHRRPLHDESDTAALASEVSLFAAAGDFIGLTGDLGAGKTTFVRALIMAYSKPEAATDVPSPTFTLVQTYDACRVPVAHFDLYRLIQASDTDELGMEDLMDSHLVAVEWADRFDDALPADRLMVELVLTDQERTATLTGHGTWQRRLKRLVQAGEFAKAHADGCIRTFLQGDASARRYERLFAQDGSTKLLMDMPAKTEPPSLDGGVPYGQRVHLADDISAVVAINSQLTKAGFSAPRICATDLESGFAILEDFGDRVFGGLANYGDVGSVPLREAVTLLVDIAQRDWPSEVAVDHTTHVIQQYDLPALMEEAELLPMWFWPLVKDSTAPVEISQEYESLLRPLLQALAEETPVLVLRDYHSPNLIWLPERQGSSRVGIIDTQDAMLGPAAYDLVSLLQDARIDIPADVETEMFGHYISLRRRHDPAFDEDRFRRTYAILGAQRAAKILGIFARLSKRDGKHGYLRHLPRVSASLERNLMHPALAGLSAWFERYLPSDVRETAGGQV